MTDPIADVLYGNVPAYQATGVPVEETTNPTVRRRTFIPIINTFATVRFIARELGGWVTADDIRNEVGREYWSQLSVAVVEVEFAALHDYGMGTKAFHQFRFDGIGAHA